MVIKSLFSQKKIQWIQPHNDSLLVKQRLLAPYFTPQFMQGRSLLDLGANGGFFSFWALLNGSKEVVALDTDKNYLENLTKILIRLDLTELQIANSNIVDWNTPADNVLALALIHWIYSCTSLFGSLDAVIKKLADLTKHMLIVEWVDPIDEAISFFHHLDWNKELVQASYTFDAFIQALDTHFVRYEKIGDINSTRQLYIAYRHYAEIDLTVPFPFLQAKNTIISSRCLAQHNEIEYWSVVYEYDEDIYKQATLDLAQREGYFLSKFDSSYFPKIKDIVFDEKYSVIRLEKIQGKRLHDAICNIQASPNSFYEFTLHCLNLLEELKDQKIVHRDIRMDNILVRNAVPVLLDFGWAISDDKPYFTPSGLNYKNTPSNGNFCDIYSMGKVLQRVNHHHYASYDLVISLMVANDADFRTTDITFLKRLFLVAKEMTENGHHSTKGE